MFMNISPSVLEDLSAWHVFVMPIIQSKWCQWKLNTIVHRDLPTCTLGCFKRHFSRVGGIAAVRKFCTDYTSFTSHSCLVGETGETKSDWNTLPMFFLSLNLCVSKSEMFLKWLIDLSKSLQTSWTCWELLKKKKKKNITNLTVFTVVVYTEKNEISFPRLLWNYLRHVAILLSFYTRIK